MGTARLLACSLLFSLGITIYPALPAHALETKVIPARVMQGDPFIVRVTGVKAPLMPEASVSGRDLSFSSCGEGCFHAVGAVDMDARPGVYRISLSVGTKKTKAFLSVAKASFPTIRLTVPKEKVSPSPEDLKRIGEEETLLKSFWPLRTEKLWEGTFIHPVETPLSTEYGTKRLFNGERVSVHRGVDFRGKEGEEVRAANRGKVVLAAELFFGGNTVILDHGQGVFTVYMHLSRFRTAAGDIASKGDVIGYVGSTGRATGPHLHFGVKVMEVNANPVSFFRLSL